MHATQLSSALLLGDAALQSSMHSCSRADPHELHRSCQQLARLSQEWLQALNPGPPADMTCTRTSASLLTRVCNCR